MEASLFISALVVGGSLPFPKQFETALAGVPFISLGTLALTLAMLVQAQNLNLLGRCSPCN